MIRGAVSKYRPWTAAEKQAVQDRYVADGPKKLAAELGRSFEAVCHKAQVLGVRIRRRWTADDDRLLRNLWGELSVAAIAKKLNRTATTTFWRAQTIGLPLGCPDGMEYFSDAADRAGFSRPALERILLWAGKTIKRSMSRGLKDVSYFFRIVDPFDVDEAVRDWLETETLEEAARRVRVDASTLCRRLLELGGPSLPPKPTTKQQWRIPSTLVDRVVEAAVAAGTLVPLPAGGRHAYRGGLSGNRGPRTPAQIAASRRRGEQLRAEAEARRSGCGPQREAQAA